MKERRAALGVEPCGGSQAEFQRTLEGQGVLLAWPRFGALTPTHRTGYRPAGSS